MLETLRKNSRTALIYILFGVIIAAFILSFGPGSRGFGASGGSGSSYAVKVAGNTVTEQDFRFVFVALGGTQFPAQMARERRMKELVMDKLIERELLAQEAERIGFYVSKEEVEDMIADGRMMVMGVPRRVDSYVFKNGKFDYDRFKTVSQNQLGVSVMHFIRIEQRELLADKMRELMRGATKVTSDEVKADFEQKGRQVNLEYVRFSSHRYEDEGEISAAEIDAYVKAHADELKKAYEERAFLYKKIDKQARLRHLLIAVPKDAKDDSTEAKEAKKKIEAAAVAAKQSFTEAAKKSSTDELTRGKGGLIGWRKKGFTGLGEALDTKIFAAKKGEIIGPERNDRGWELVLVEDFREGDVPLEVAQREIAEEKVRGEKAKAKAKADAEAILAKVKAGEKLEVLVPKQSAEQKQEEAATKTIGRRLQEAPKLSETGLFARRGEMVQDIGVSKELAKRAFELKAAELAGPFEVAGGAVLVRCKEHKEPDMTDFEKRKAELTREFQRAKWAELLEGWSKQRCQEVREHIQVNDEILSYEGLLPTRTPGEKTKYEPCATRPF